MLEKAMPLSPVHPSAAPTNAAAGSVDPSVALAAQGDVGGAEQSFQSRLRQNRDDATLHHNYAVFLGERQRRQEAAAHFQRALALRSHYPEALRNFALLLSSQRRFDEALGHLWLGVALRPDDPQMLLTLGITLIGARRATESIPVFRQACRLSPRDPLAFNQLGLGFFDAGRFPEAEEAFLRALDLDPKLVSAHNNLGSLYKAMGRLGEALSSFELSLTLDPEAPKTRWNRALTLLSAGDMVRGWRDYEARWKSPDTPPKQFPQPLWQGESLEGKTILLYAEQGLGDTVQFIRYAALLKARGANVMFHCPAPLLDIVDGVSGLDQVVPEEDSLPPFDFHSPLLGLPRLFQTDVSTIPSDVPYLTPTADRVTHWHEALRPHRAAGEFLVGIAWQGNPHHQWDHFRSVPLMTFELLSQVPGVRLVSLQRGPGVEQIEVFQHITKSAMLVPTDGQQTLPEHLQDTVALMANLDLVISVDTLPAHLAGALARPTWVALSTVADWRWMLERHDSPWYPTMRLFRQRRFGDWEEVFERMASHLLRVVSARPERKCTCPSST